VIPLRISPPVPPNVDVIQRPSGLGHLQEIVPVGLLLIHCSTRSRDTANKDALASRGNDYPFHTTDIIWGTNNSCDEKDSTSVILRIHLGHRKAIPTFFLESRIDEGIMNVAAREQDAHLRSYMRAWPNRALNVGSE